MSWEDFMYAADFLALGGLNHISLLGGEPTLHPEFTELVRYLYERGFHSAVFTSGVLSATKLADLVSLLEKLEETQVRLNFICNVNHPSISPEQELERQYAFLAAVKSHACLSYNIYQPDFDLDFLADYIERFELKRHVRLGLAHPIYQAQNLFIAKEQMKTVADRLVAAYPLFSQREITLGMDCGFPMCMFDDNGLGKMYKLSTNGIAFHCGAAIDIGTSLDVWPCFPLSGYERRSLYDFSSFKELEDYERTVVEKIRETQKGIFPECAICPHRKANRCSGGCAAHVLSQKIERQSSSLSQDEAGVA